MTHIKYGITIVLLIGAYLLGCRKPVEKIHGAANERTIPYAVGLMRSMILSKMTEKISEQLDAMSRKVD